MDLNPTETFPYEHFCNYFPQMNPSNEGAANTPEEVMACGERALMYLSDFESVNLNGKRRIYAVCLLTAHILYCTNVVDKETASGGGTTGSGEASVGPVTSASVGGVSVSMQTPTSSSDGPLEWWLNKSPYGQEFLALVRSRGPMMAYVGSRTPVLPLR